MIKTPPCRVGPFDSGSRVPLGRGSILFWAASTSNPGRFNALRISALEYKVFYLFDLNFVQN
jgi:hypothetical protein